ncbi:hypothetical protein [Aestuariispira insulae]|nr:hypothetical protein [Aestuariispira insulae]
MMLEIALGGLFALFVLGALVCQLLAMRHRTEDAMKFMHKDSMFKHKELVFTPEGMRYIRLQKKLAVGVMLVSLAFALLYSNSNA